MGLFFHPPADAQVIDTGVARWWREGPYIVNQRYAPGSITVESLREGFAATRALGGGVRRPLITALGPATGASRAGRDLVAGPEGVALFSAMAIVVGSPTTRTLANLFVRLSAPPFPVRLFTDPSEARAWALAQARGV